MSELDAINKTNQPITRERIANDLRAIGLGAGMVVLLHSSLRSLGWVPGGTQSVILAFTDALTATGTLMVPTHSDGNSEPSNWENPPVPASWWATIRAHMPAYDPATTPTRGMGQIADAARNWPGAHRSDHPQFSFAALGAQAAHLTATRTPLSQPVGDDSPLGRLYATDGWVMLLGVDHFNNTSLHLAEERADYPKTTVSQGAAILVNGEQQWATWERIDYETDDFGRLGRAFETAHPEHVRRGKVGQATARLLRQRPMVDFAVAWMEANRTAQNPDS